MAVFMLAIVSLPAYAASEGAETFYQVMSPLYFAWTKYQEWKESHPNEPDSAYTGFIPGGTFGGGAGRKDHFEEDYKNYVSTLPASGYTSDGALLWQPTVKDVLGNLSGQKTYYYAPPLVADFRTVSSLPSGISELDDGTGYKMTGHYTNGELSPSDFNGFGWRVGVRRPISGIYSSLVSTKVHGKFFYSDGSNSTYAENWPQSNPKYFSADTNFVIGVDRFFVSAFTDSRGVLSYNFSWFFPFFKIVPDTALNDVDYGMVTRPTSISGGNYGIVGDNGQITKVENNSTIVNETNNTYYNPVTGQTQPITNWAYDYSDRSYTLTLDGGKTSTVTYGDEYITIQEGDTVYNVYYVVDGSGTENPPAACTHDWQETSTTPATCTVSGSKLLTCSKCQQTKSETVPALGHDWQVKQTVTTQYDDSGQLTQQGYTIYQCSRCGEQYKSTDGTAPPGGGSGTAPGGEDDTTIGGLIEKLLSGLGGVLSGIIKGLLSLLTQAVEAISGIGELFTSFVASLVGLWGGFTDFLAAVFPFLPEEFITIVELGLILMIAAAVFKKFAS